MTIKEIAKMTGKSKRSVERWISCDKMSQVACDKMSQAITDQIADIKKVMIPTSQLVGTNNGH
jgi:transposase